MQIRLQVIIKLITNIEFIYNLFIYFLVSTSGVTSDSNPIPVTSSSNSGPPVYDDVALEHTFGHHMLSFSNDPIEYQTAKGHNAVTSSTSDSTASAVASIITTSSIPPTAVVTVNAVSDASAKDVKCQYCEATFARAGNLIRHTKKFHEEMDETQREAEMSQVQNVNASNQIQRLGQQQGRITFLVI